MDYLCRYWNASDFAFSRLPGVLDVTLGYAGGLAEHPCHSKMGDHSEALRVTYDPQITSYEAILQVFSDILGGPPRRRSRNKRCACLYHTPSQREAAMELVRRLCLRYDVSEVALDIEPATEFYEAERFYQKCFERQF